MNRPFGSEPPLSVVPLVLATGSGSEMRQALGTAVLSGMLGVTFFGQLFAPAFYTVIRWLEDLIMSAAARGSKRHALST